MKKSLFLNKKAMNPGEMFIYLASLIIVAFILIFGYMAINDFIGNSSDVEMLQFQKTMEQYVRRYSTEFGSQGFGEVPMPGNVMRACFTEYYNDNSNIIDCNSLPLTQINPILKNSYGANFETREKKNFFLFDSKGNFLGSYYLGNLTVSKHGVSCNHLCINSHRGRLVFSIKGQGVSAEISE